MKNLKTLSSSLILILGGGLLSFSVFSVDNDNAVKEENTTTKSAEECQAPI